jgi:hypothetical protein
VEQRRIEECKSQLVPASPEFFRSVNNSRPSSSYLFKDFGMCPVGGAFCNEGGEPLATKSNIYHPVPAGYIGEQNCFHCRFFITGPAFMTGLAGIFNEISLAVNTVSFRYGKLEDELDDVVQKIEIIAHEIYEQKCVNKETERTKEDLAVKRQKLNSEIETRAKKLDLYMGDMNAIHKHLKNFQDLLCTPKSKGDEDKLQLIVRGSYELGIELEEVSYFQQLHEVCENAELYHSCSDDFAVTRRSQALDKMMVRNNIPARMFLLSESEQLAVGNQLTLLMLERLKSWKVVDELIEGGNTLRDFGDDIAFSAKTIQQLFEQSKPLLGGN